jgi:hypothetical protein
VTLGQKWVRGRSERTSKTRKYTYLQIKNASNEKQQRASWGLFLGPSYIANLSKYFTHFNFKASKHFSCTKGNVKKRTICTAMPKNPLDSPLVVKPTFLVDQEPRLKR